MSHFQAVNKTQRLYNIECSQGYGAPRVIYYTKQKWDHHDKMLIMAESIAHHSQQFQMVPGSTNTTVESVSSSHLNHQHTHNTVPLNKDPWYWLQGITVCKHAFQTATRGPYVYLQMIFCPFSEKEPGVVIYNLSFLIIK